MQHDVRGETCSTSRYLASDKLSNLHASAPAGAYFKMCMHYTGWTAR